MKNFYYKRIKKQRKILEQIDTKKLFRLEQMILDTSDNGGKIIIVGNGGSAATASHVAVDLSLNSNVKAINFNEADLITCFANDFGYEFVFSRYIEAWGNKGDVLLAISTSGNSSNVINAVKMAQKKEMNVIGLLGKNGGELSTLVNIPLVVPYTKSTDRIQEIHIKLIHLFIEGIERNLFPQNY